MFRKDVISFQESDIQVFTCPEMKTRISFFTRIHILYEQEIRGPKMITEYSRKVSVPNCSSFFADFYGSTAIKNLNDIFCFLKLIYFNGSENIMNYYIIVLHVILLSINRAKTGQNGTLMNTVKWTNWNGKYCRAANSRRSFYEAVLFYKLKGYIKYQTIRNFCCTTSCFFQKMVIWWFPNENSTTLRTLNCHEGCICFESP